MPSSLSQTAIALRAYRLCRSIQMDFPRAMFIDLYNLCAVDSIAIVIYNLQPTSASNSRITV